MDVGKLRRPGVGGSGVGAHSLPPPPRPQHLAHLSCPGRAEGAGRGRRGVSLGPLRLSIGRLAEGRRAAA